jgi:hypothetical protein
MIYLVPTKHGLGVELWGHYEDLRILYDTIAKYGLDENKHIKSQDNRDKVISGFVHEIRKAYEGSRLTRDKAHYFSEASKLYGAQISWVHFLFSLAAIRYNMRFDDVDKFDASILMQIEWWLEKAMYNFDEIGAKSLSPFIDGAIYGANDYIYQFMRTINLQYFLLKGGKKAFRQLPELLKTGIYGTDNYNAYKISLEADAKKFNCKPNELEINDDNFDYDNIKW